MPASGHMLRSVLLPWLPSGSDSCPAQSPTMKHRVTTKGGQLEGSLFPLLDPQGFHPALGELRIVETTFLARSER